MRFTESDIAYLREMGCEDKDIPQIKEAAGKTKYLLNGEQRISISKAIEVLGRKTFLSGIARSAFHWTALRMSDDEKNEVFFDSSKLFAS